MSVDHRRVSQTMRKNDKERIAKLEKEVINLRIDLNNLKIFVEGFIKDGSTLFKHETKSMPRVQGKKENGRSDVDNKKNEG